MDGGPRGAQAQVLKADDPAGMFQKATEWYNGEIGRSGVAFDPAHVEIALAGTTVYRDGMPTVWTCDFIYDYVKINAEYHT